MKHVENCDGGEELHQPGNQAHIWVLSVGILGSLRVHQQNGDLFPFSILHDKGPAPCPISLSFIRTHSTPEFETLEGLSLVVPARPCDGVPVALLHCQQTTNHAPENQALALSGAPTNWHNDDGTISNYLRSESREIWFILISVFPSGSSIPHFTK